jgi:hypothetical protein
VGFYEYLRGGEEVELCGGGSPVHVPGGFVRAEPGRGLFGGKHRQGVAAHHLESWGGGVSTMEEHKIGEKGKEHVPR